METRHLQRRIGAAADLPWSVATTEDLRRAYHLMASPAMLFNTAVIFSACRAAVRGMPEVNPRPRALNALAAHRWG